MAQPIFKADLTHDAEKHQAAKAKAATIRQCG
jgi:hypothetical protein